MEKDKIKELLIKNNIEFIENGVICGSIIPSLGAYRNGLGNIMHTMTNHIIHFSQHGITIIAMDDMTGNLIENSLVFISNNELVEIVIKQKFYKLVLILRSKQGEVTYHIQKSVLSCPWHKENLAFLLLQMQTGKAGD